jgi:hypothetical protein
MRHRTVAATRSVIAGFLAILVLAGAAPAFAQVTDTLIVACKSTDCTGFGGAVNSPYTDLQLAIDDAIALSVNVGRVTVLIIEDDTGAPWSGVALNIPADANIRILGVPDDVTLGGAFSVVLEGTGAAPVITIDGALVSEPTDLLEIEGVTLTGGTDGVLVTGTTDAGNATSYSPVINRCYITANNENGVRVEGNGEPLLVNNSINLNGENGVQVGDPNVGSTGARPDILHCSILENGANGVFVASGNDARVRNTLVYRNGNADGEGGLVWETNAFIDPDVGPVTGGTPVTINGANFGAGAGSVYFGPPSRTDTAATIGAWGDTQITCTTPAAWTGKPGPVDVYIVRADGMEQIVRDGFTYEAPVGTAPVVTHVVPEWGPIVGQNWVYVYGANFDSNPDVSFGGVAALKVNWINSGQLQVKVPPATAAGKVEVQVENANGNISAITPPEDYEYRATTELAPEIVQITPNYYRDVDGSGPNSTVTALADIVGFYFDDEAVVKIGGIVCPHGTVEIINGASTPPLLNITDVQIPVAEFGAAGAYDVEVVNPSGLRDVLPNGFTYYSDGEPHTNPDGPGDGPDTLNENKWRAANPDVPSGGNMVLLGTGGDRVLLGHSFDHTIDISFDGGTTSVSATPSDAMFPHNQRQVFFPFPATPDLAPVGVALTDRAIPVQVRNTGTVLGNPSTGFGADTTIFYADDFAPASPPPAGQGLYFEITGVRVTALGSPDTIEIDVRNWRNTMRIFVGQALATPTNPPSDGTATIAFQAPTQGQQGYFGPVDIRVELPSGDPDNGFGENLYTVAENAYSYRRLDNPPEVYSVIPRTAPVANTHFKVLGANFIGPAPAIGATNNDVFTRLVLIWTLGDSITIEPGALGVTNYEVTSFSEINFDFDLSVYPAATYPPGIANLVDIRAEQVQGTTVLLDSGGANLASTLPDALYFDALPPTITSVTPAEGPVSGFDAITGAPISIVIDGANFGAAASIVRFGSAEAEVTAWSDIQITVELPPAPQGLPGIYDVTVIRADQQQGVLHDGFTYFMDGRPIVTEIEPNHTEFNPLTPPTTTEKTYVTIRGYNFDDIVRVIFTIGTKDFEQTFYSVSPTEIVVSLPDFQSELLLEATDYDASGVATLQVTVQNDPLIFATGTTQADDLTSNAEDFFVYNDGRGDVSPADPEFAFNDVYFNWEDYINTQPGVGSISVDPMLDTGPGGVPVPGPKNVVPLAGGWWYGKLLATDLATGEFVDNPIRNKGGEFTVEPFTSADFENEPRPDPPQNENIQGTGSTDSSLPDIGADEINGFAADECGWTFARPNPNPVGILEMRDLQVEIRVTPGCIDPVAFIVPQGANPQVPEHRVGLEIAARLGGGAYLYRSTTDIQTILVDNDLDGEPSQGDYLMDGHAAIYLVDAFDNSDPPNIIGYDEVSDTGSLTESGLIQSQAVYGRHFLIDTIPPRVRVESGTYGTNGFDNVIIASSVVGIVNDHNDPITANDADPATHPFPLPTDMLSDGTRWDPATVLAPVDYLGGITLPPLAGVDGTKVFFNNGSIANNSAASLPGVPSGNLIFNATIEFVDPPVTDPLGIEIGGNLEDTDIYDPSHDTRQRAGFLPVEPPTDAFDIGAGRWDFETGANLLIGAPVMGTYTTSGTGPGSNQGFYDPAYLEATGDAVPPPVQVQMGVSNEVLIPIWAIQAPGIDWNVANDDLFHVAAQMIAQDLAGNETPDEEDFETDPLHIWWPVNVQSRLSPDREGQATVSGNFTMQLNRSVDPQAEGGPVPIFMYRVYTAPDYLGPYIPVTGWTDWSSATSISNISSIPGVLGQWVLVVCQGADEAGNVEPWWGGLVGPAPTPPTDGPIDLSDPVHDEWARILPNWQRFFFSGIAAPDTRVEPTFWHDLDNDIVIDGGEPNFGQSRLIPLPTDAENVPVRAQFLVSTVRPPGAIGSIRVQWEFLESGRLPDSGVMPFVFISDSQVAPIFASNPANIDDIAGTFKPAPYEAFLGDVPLRQQPVTYVFRAAAFYDLPPENGVFEPLAGEIMDPTPANVYFTVVPTGVSGFIKSPTDEDSQPIKEQEIR